MRNKSRILTTTRVCNVSVVADDKTIICKQSLLPLFAESIQKQTSQTLSRCFMRDCTQMQSLFGNRTCRGNRAKGKRDRSLINSCNEQVARRSVVELLPWLKVYSILFIYFVAAYGCLVTSAAERIPRHGREIEEPKSTRLLILRGTIGILAYMGHKLRV